ncbi:MAG: hypothetical protein K6E27_10495 [Eubacterium sp.]|nr:hypothetical protein [Eubacterium sp.]
MSTTYEVAYAVLESVCYMGFQNIVVIASHADPQHQMLQMYALKSGIDLDNRIYEVYLILGENTPSSIRRG